MKKVGDLATAYPMAFRESRPPQPRHISCHREFQATESQKVHPPVYGHEDRVKEKIVGALSSAADCGPTNRWARLDGVLYIVNPDSDG